MRYFLEIAYRGTHYSGWQVQPNGISVQQKIDEALCMILRDDIHCIGCGRTDAGVHAEQFFLHFDTNAHIPANFPLRMNTFLPDDILVKRIIEVDEKAHARFDATERSYEYRMLMHKEIFIPELVYYYHYQPLDFEQMEKACKVILQFDDFPSFCKSKQGAKTTIVHLTDLHWEHKGDAHVLHVSADRFLRGMVRLIMGAMLQIGKGKMTLAELEKGLQKKERFKYALSAPANGLFLTKVKYPYIRKSK
ncbi:MAG: tRNA pseudouridine(38-40) synthase TruA [Chitinophagales bacterium]